MSEELAVKPKSRKGRPPVADRSTLATVPIMSRVTSRQRERLDDLAVERGTTVSALIRSMVVDCLGRAEPWWEAK
jgi:hypothetical protein